MITVYFHDLTAGWNDPVELHELPRAGDTIGLAPSKSFYLVKGVTQNKFDTEKHLKEHYEFEVYAVQIEQSDWIHSLR